MYNILNIKNKTLKIKEMENLCDNKNYVVIDFEIAQVGTTNLLEIGAIYIEDLKINDQYSRLIKPNQPIQDKITEITHITNDMVKDESNENIVVNEFFKWLKPKLEKGAIIVAHNVSFEKKILNAKIEEYNFNYDLKYVCTYRLSSFYFPLYHKHTLDNLCLCFDVPLEQHHRALDDCIMTTKYFLKLYKNVIPLSKENKYDDIYNLMIRSLNYKNDINVSAINYWEKDIGKKKEKWLHRLYIYTNKDTYVYNLDDKLFYEKNNKSKELRITNKMFFSLCLYIENKFKVHISSKKEFYEFIKNQFLVENNQIVLK